MADQREEIQQRLIEDLQNGKFILFYQAIARIAPSVIEVPSYRQILVRFQEEEEGMMPPGTFIPMLEECGLMPVLDRWVTQQVVKWIGAEAAKVPNKPPPRCSVTLSIDTLRRDPGFIDYAVRRVQKGKIRPGCLEFEFPLSEAIVHAKSLAGVIEPLRKSGCSFGMSGFTGETIEFELVESLGITFVKVDSGLVYGVAKNAEARARIVKVFERCHQLGMHMICPQVEDTETLEALRGLNVEYAQGFGIERPQALT